MKKEKYDYFEEFIKDAGYLIKATQILEDTLKSFSQKKLEENIEKIHEVENDADGLLHNMFKVIMRDFLPPLDREDIILIIRTLDDIIDYIDEVIINFNIFNIAEIREDTLQFSDFLRQAGEYILEMFKDLKNFKKKNKIKEIIIAINDIEGEADQLFEKAIKKLYSDSKDPIEIIKWTNLYNCLENTIDACEHISDCVEDVLMKNS